jgi:nicotinate dehydrogenase subunit A
LAVHFQLNGKAVATTLPESTPLLYVLRDEFEVNGPRFGCGLGECGACTVHVNGAAVRSCSVPVLSAAGTKVITLEGLGTADKPAPLQQAFIDQQAAQCGYCTNGMIMQAAAFLASTPKPTVEEIREGMAANLCRCGTHLRFIRAIQQASGQKVTV